MNFLVVFVFKRAKQRHHICEFGLDLRNLTTNNNEKQLSSQCDELLCKLNFSFLVFKQPTLRGTNHTIYTVHTEL